MSFAKEKNLIVYFSHAGENYSGGKTIYLSVGNTKRVAEILKEQTGCQTWKLETVTPYPAGYQTLSELAQKEQRNASRPRLSAYPQSLEGYEGIFLGYPIWWGTVPMAVLTFLEKYNWQHLRLYPFCTHEGSGLGRSLKDITAACRQAEIMSGLAVRGSEAMSAQAEVRSWLSKVLA